MPTHTLDETYSKYQHNGENFEALSLKLEIGQTETLDSGETN